MQEMDMNTMGAILIDDRNDVVVWHGASAISTLPNSRNWARRAAPRQSDHGVVVFIWLQLCVSNCVYIYII